MSLSYESCDNGTIKRYHVEREPMKELVTIAFRHVRGIRQIHSPDNSSTISHTAESLRDMLHSNQMNLFSLEGKKGCFYLRVWNNGWIGVTTDIGVNEILIKAALERAWRLLCKHDQLEQRLAYIQKDIEDYFSSRGVSAKVRDINLFVKDTALSGKIHITAREGRKEAIREQLVQFIEKQLPHFIDNNVNIIIEKQSLLDRITRDQLLKIIRRVERL
jgi:hypothetical protein